MIIEEKIRWAVNGFGSYKTAGEDGIFPGLSQQGIETLVVPLCKILTGCLTFGYVLKAWQKVRVIFIPKPGCSSYELAKSFRPLENDGKAGGSSYKRGTVKGLSFKPHAARIPERQID
jgi:hypothetical protein